MPPGAGDPPRVGPWQAVEALTPGGSSQVWLARRGDQPAAWVVKIARPELQDVLSREWRALLEVPLAMIPEPVWITPVLEGLQPAQPGGPRGRAQALVLQLCPGEPLNQALAGRSAGEVRQVGAALLRGLAVLHGRGWVHGDLHPGNVLVQWRGSQPQVTLLDLGLADRCGESIRGPGRLDCAAPERLRGGRADPRDDLFSVAAALWQAWLGSPAWPSYPLQMPEAQQRPEVPASLELEKHRLLLALSAMLAPERDHRPQDAEAALRLWQGRDDEEDNRRWWAQALRALSHRKTFWLPEEFPLAGPLWIGGPAGSGRTSLLTSLATAAAEAGQACAWLSVAADGALEFAAAMRLVRHSPAALAGSMLGDGLAQLAEQAARWLGEQLADLGGPGLLLVDDADRLGAVAAALLQRLVADPKPLCGWRLIAVGGQIPQGASSFLLPAQTQAELADRLSAASGGRRWDAAVVAALTQVTGARRGEVFELAAELLERGALELGPGLVSWGVDTSEPQAMVAELALARRVWSLPGEAHWPLLARAAVAACVWGGAVEGITDEERNFAERSPLLVLRGAGQVAMADEAAREYALGQLPPAVVAAEMRNRGQTALQRSEAALWQARAWQLDGQGEISPDQMAAAIAGLQSRGEFAAVDGLCARWLPAQAQDSADPRLADVAAAWLSARVAQGRLAEAEALSAQWPSSWRGHRGLLLARAEAAFRGGLYPQCRELALDLTGRDPSDVDGWLWLVFAATWQGDRQAAAVALERAVELASAQPDKLAICQYLSGLHSYYAGRLDEAEESLAELLPHVSAGLLSAVLGALGLVSHRRGDLAKARSHYQRAAGVAEAIGDRLRAINMSMNSAVVDHEAGELGRALAGYARVIQLAEHAGNPGAEARARNNRANLLTTIGLFASAQRDLEAALRLWLQVGNGYMEGNARCLLGEIARREGHLAEAELQLAQADSALESAGAVHERSEILLERAHMLLLRGDLAGARGLVQRLRSEASAAGQRELHGRALVLSAQTELESAPFRPLPTEKLAQIDDDLRLALELLPTSKPLHRTLAAALRVRLLLQRGRLQEAIDLAGEQMALVERVALTLEGPERTAFERAPGDAAPRAVLTAVAQLHLDPASQGGRSGLLPTLVAINRRLGGQRDVAELLETVMDSAVLLTGAERGFLLIDEGDCADPPELRAARLRVAVARNLDRENLKRPQHKLSHSVAEQVFASGETVLSLDAQLDARFAEQASVHTGSLRSILCVPLRAQSGALGVVYVDNRFASGAFTPEHAALLAALADQAAIALQTARLIAEQRATAEALEKARAEVESLNGQLRAQLAEVEDQLDHARADLDAQRLAIVRRSDYSQIKGESPHLLRLFGLMDRVRDHDFPVLLRGESGTGKELVARAIHFTGRRKRGPFVAVNCGALPPNLLESELFGHTRGAFTGAVAERRGLFEAAHGGTLLLDEVGEMPLEMQVKLLRVLQTGEITRVGETASRKVDARVVAATHRDLQAMVGQGSFREDLLYRLKVVELVIPPLRQRPEDIPLLVEYFTAENRKASLGNVQRVSKAAMARLVQFSWPGNIRQLETVLKAACLFADSTVLELLDIEPLLSRERADVAVTHGQNDPGAWWESASLPEIEERLLASRLARFDGNKKRAAESLGIDRGTLYNKLRDKGGRA